MAKRHYQRQAEEELDDGYDWGSHRGGGGAPLRSSDGKPISKLGTVISGNIRVDEDRYNSVHRNDKSASVHELTRPNTSYHTPTHKTPANLFDPAPPIHEAKSSVPVTPIRRQRGHSPNLPTVNSNVDEVITHNMPRSNRLRVTNVIQEHSRQQNSHKQHQSHHQHESHREENVSNHHTSNKNSDIKTEVARVLSQSEAINNNEVQVSLLKEISDLKLSTRRQTRLQSIRWGLDNIELVEECVCVGGRRGEEVSHKGIKNILKEVLCDFLKGKSHNIGTRKTSCNADNKQQTEVAFLELVYESLHLLCGVEPSLSRRPDGDCDVYIGEESY